MRRSRRAGRTNEKPCRPMGPQGGSSSKLVGLRGGLSNLVPFLGSRYRGAQRHSVEDQEASQYREEPDTRYQARAARLPSRSESSLPNCPAAKDRR